MLFRGATRSACGGAQAAAGPLYCSADRKLYLDTAFFDELSRRFGAPGDFAQAYVIAHEVGHHVQNLTGTMRKVDQQMQRTDARGRNALSVRLELQADCYAGIWGYFAQKRNKLEPGDLEEGFRAAAAVGDDASRSARKATSCPSRSPTAARSSGCAGSGRDWNPATCGVATPSRPDRPRPQPLTPRHHAMATPISSAA